MSERGCQLFWLHMAEDHTNTGNGARFNFRVRDGIGWVPRPLAGNPLFVGVLRFFKFSLGVVCVLGFALLFVYD